MKVEQVAQIAKLWAGTSCEGLKRDGSLDMRRFHKDSLTQGWFMGILNEDGTFDSGSNYPSLWDAAVLWELLKDAIAASPGYSLARNQVWRSLGLWEMGSRCHQESMAGEMEAVLLALHQSGFIYFQAAGSIWSISIR